MRASYIPLFNFSLSFTPLRFPFHVFQSAVAPTRTGYQDIVVPYLPCLTNLTHLMLDDRDVGRALPKAMKTIQYLTNLEKLELKPGNLSCIAYLARDGVLTKLNYLSICGKKRAYYSEAMTYFYQKEDVMPTDGLEYFLEKSVLPALTTLKLERFLGNPEVWQCLGSLAPKVEYLSVNGQLGQHTKTPKTLDDLYWARNFSTRRQVQLMAESFLNLKRLEVAKKYVLGARHFLKARTTREHYFDIDLGELEEPNEEEKWMKTADVQCLEPLSAEVLRFDERYRYSRDAMEVIGALWKDSSQGKKEMMKLRGKLAVHHF